MLTFYDCGLLLATVGKLEYILSRLFWLYYEEKLANMLGVRMEID